MRIRSIAAFLIFALAAILTVPAISAFWAQRTVTNSQRYIETVGPLASLPSVQTAVENTVSNAIIEKVNSDQIVTDIFGKLFPNDPAAIQKLIPIISGATDGFIRAAVHKFVSSPQFQKVWLAANEGIQKALMRVLEGNDGGPVTLNGDQLTLNLDLLIAAVQQQMIANGADFMKYIKIDTGKEIVLLDAPQLKTVQTLYAFTKPLATWAIFAVAGLFLAAILIARRRARAVAVAGILITINAAVLVVAIAFGQKLVTNAFVGTVFEQAMDDFYAQLFVYLRENSQGLLLIGVLLILIGWFAGGSRSGRATRGWVAALAEGPGSKLPDGPLTRFGEFIARHAVALRVAILLIGTFFLVYGVDISVDRTLVILAITILALLVLQILVGAGRRNSEVVESAGTEVTA